jgi:RND family efflux transporter MFP subunit
MIKLASMKIKKWYVIPAAIALILIVYLVFFRKDTIPVKEIPIKNVVVKRTVSAPGEVKSVNEADLSFASVGRVGDIVIKNGEKVQKGKYLAMMENYSESQTAQSLKDTRDAAQLDLELFIENYETKKDAVGGQDEYAIQLKKYRELANKAEAAYQAQLGAIGKTYIYAPFDGTIIDTEKEVGETVSAGTTIVRMADLDQIIFEIELDQEDYGYLNLGQEVEVTLDAFDNETFMGEVSSLPSFVNSNNGGDDFIVEVTFTGENKNKPLLGMTGDAYIILDKTEGEAPALTFDEIEYDIEDKPFVYIETNGKAERKYLDIGLQGDIYTELKTKVEAPIIQVSDSKFKLDDGVAVKLQR